MKCKAILCASLVLAAGAAGCKSTTSAEGGSGGAAPATSGKVAKQAPKAIPADSPFAKIRLGMPRAQVDDLIGPPTSTRVFPSGKGFIPFYYGPDTMRTAASYRGSAASSSRATGSSTTSTTIPPRTGTDSRPAAGMRLVSVPEPLVPPRRVLSRGRHE